MCVRCCCTRPSTRLCFQLLPPFVSVLRVEHNVCAMPGRHRFIMSRSIYRAACYNSFHANLNAENAVTRDPQALLLWWGSEMSRTTRANNNKKQKEHVDSADKPASQPTNKQKMCAQRWKSCDGEGDCDGGNGAVWKREQSTERLRPQQRQPKNMWSGQNKEFQFIFVHRCSFYRHLLNRLRTTHYCRVAPKLDKCIWSPLVDCLFLASQHRLTS